MNTKTLISTLALTLALGTLALPGTAAARDYERDGDRYQQSRDLDTDRGEYRRHDNGRQHQQHQRNRHDNGHHYGQIHWAPYIPKYQPKQRVYQMHNDGGYFDPRVILHIETHL